MALQGSGTISLSQIQAEFTGANPISMSEYYRGGSYVPTSVGGAAGAWTSFTGNTAYGYSYNTTQYTTVLYWGGVQIRFQGGPQFSYSSGGYDYEPGPLWSSSGGGKGGGVVYYYQVRRRISATSITVNTSIPASGQISMSQFYGGRKT